MVNQERFERIRQYFFDHKDQLIGDLAYLVSYPSVKSASENADEPFGHDSAVCLEKTAALFASEGLTVSRYPSEGYALAETCPGEPSVGLFVHTDVVPVSDDWLFTEPFQPMYRDGLLFGRGTKDNKGGAAAVLYGLKAIRDLGIRPKHNLLVFLGSNEEAGMDDIKNFAAHQPMPLFSLVPDGGFALCRGQKGILRIDVLTPPLLSLSDFSGGSAYNVVMDECFVTAAVNDLPQNLPEAITVSGKPGAYKITALGRSAHASTPWDGESALKVLVDFLLTLALPENDKAVLSAVAASLADHDGSAFGIKSKSELFYELTCANGIARSENGGLCYTFDIRFGDALDEAVMLSRLTDWFARAGLKMTIHSHSHCLLNPEDTPAVQAFLAGFRGLTFDKNAGTHVMGGGTYAYYLKNAYATGFLFAEPDEASFSPGPGRGQAHQSDEFVKITQILSGGALLCELLLEVDEALD